MKHFLGILENIRFGAAEVGGTVTLLLLIAYGLHKAWEEFITKWFR
jgi:hypothetical protein